MLLDMLSFCRCVTLVLNFAENLSFRGRRSTWNVAVAAFKLAGSTSTDLQTLSLRLAL